MPPPARRTRSSVPRSAHVFERIPCGRKRHVPDDRVRLDVELHLAAFPRHLAGDDRGVIGALFGADRQVDAVRELVAVLKRRLVVPKDVLRENVLLLLRHDLQQHLAVEAGVNYFCWLLLDLNNKARASPVPGRTPMFTVRREITCGCMYSRRCR